MSKKVLIIILLIIVAIVLIVVFWFWNNQEPEVIVPVDNNVPNNDVVLPDPQPQPQPRPVVPQISEEEKLQAQLTRMASSFAERYGSYSNQSNFENLEDLLSFMSVSLKRTTERIISNGRQTDTKPAIYFGVTTKALKNQVINFEPNSETAKFKVSTQRQETIGSAANLKVYYQDAEVEMIKQGGVWVVDKIEWQ